MTDNKGGKVEAASRPVPPSKGGPREFVMDGENKVWLKIHQYKLIRLHNRRVLLARDGDNWALWFRSLVSVPKRQIMETKLAMSNEAMEALILLYFSLETEGRPQGAPTPLSEPASGELPTKGNP